MFLNPHHSHVSGAPLFIPFSFSILAFIILRSRIASLFQTHIDVFPHLHLVHAHPRVCFLSVSRSPILHAWPTPVSPLSSLSSRSFSSPSSIKLLSALSRPCVAAPTLTPLPIPRIMTRTLLESRAEICLSRAELCPLPPSKSCLKVPPWGWALRLGRRWQSGGAGKGRPRRGDRESGISSCQLLI